MSNFEKDFKEIKRVESPFQRLERFKELLKENLEKDEEKKVIKEIEETNLELFNLKLWRARDDPFQSDQQMENFIQNPREIPNLEKVVKEEDVNIENINPQKAVEYGVFKINGNYQPSSINNGFKQEEMDVGYQPKSNKDEDYDERKKREEEFLRYARS